jgi:hypothetical protein
VKLPTTKEDIDHVESLFGHVGYRGCLGSIDSVHVPWRKCTCTLQTQCKNKKKDCQTVVSEVVMSHTNRVLHVSCIFWWCFADALIVMFGEVVHNGMAGKYFILIFEVSYIDGDKIIKLCPLPQPHLRTRTYAQTYPSTQRATQLKSVLVRAYCVSVQNLNMLSTSTVP